MLQFHLDQYITKDVGYFQVNNLAKYDYIPSKYMPCLFVSKDKYTAFCLIVDDLLIKPNKTNRECSYACLRVQIHQHQMRRERAVETIACAMKEYMGKVITRSTIGPVPVLLNHQESINPLPMV